MQRFPCLLAVLIFIGFRFLAESGDRSPCACSLTFSLRVVARRIREFSWSFDDEVGDVGVAELEEPVDKTRDNEWHAVPRKTLDLFAILDVVW